MTIEHILSEFRAAVKALGFKRWDKNLWALEGCAESFLTASLTSFGKSEYERGRKDGYDLGVNDMNEIDLAAKAKNL